MSIQGTPARRPAHLSGLPEKKDQRDTTETRAADATSVPRPQVFKGEARVFQSDFLESLSKVHPATPAFVGLPIVAFCLYESAIETSYGIPAVIGLMMVGYVMWTFFEYWLHRLFFHMPIVGPFTKRLHFLVHGVHHDFPWDPTRMVIPPIVSIVLSAGFYFLFTWAFGRAGYALLAGFVVGYLIYDLGHWYLHERTPKTRFGKWLRREHMVHHFRDPETRFGVSCPWMDYIFGTAGPTVARETTPIPSAEA